MDKQMSFFQRGGLLDDGQNVDPISGNEVPPGSLAEEVRDDVDAKLSEGEYVVPADVVRYYGVAYFEKLRNKAKAGLEDMEENGRIGGEPVRDSMGDELPFSDDELMFEEDGAPLEMAQGGFIAGNPGGFAPGSLGVTGSGGLGGGGTEVKTFINAAGEQRSFIFINGKPIQQIPAGFVEATEENRLKFAQDQTPEAIPTGEVTVPGTGDVDSPGVGEGTASNTSKSPVDETPSYGVGGKGASIGLGATAGGLFGGTLGAISGGLAGNQAANFNDARNSLVDAILSKDQDAISKAEKAVEDTFENLGRFARLGVLEEGKNAKQAIENVRAKTKEFLAAQAAVGAPMTTPGVAAAVGEGMAEAGDTFGGGGPSGGAAEFGGPGDGGAGFGGESGGPSESGGIGSGGIGPGGQSIWNKGGLVQKPKRTKTPPKPEGKGLVKRKPKNK
jgi:hypothetical protein